MHETREHILEVSYRLFLSKSYKEVTLQEIVVKSGLSKGAFYHYFKSKEQLFLEIIHFAFSSGINIDYVKFSKASLYQFCSDYISYFKALNEAHHLMQTQGEEGFSMNHYSLIFDALRLFPDFRREMEEYSRIELAAWMGVIHKARETGEIKPVMTDEQIAKLFIHTSNGVGMNNIMMGRSDDTVKDWQELWEGIYAQLKG